MNPRDVGVLLQLARADESWSMRRLSGQGGVPLGTLHRSAQRLAQVGLYDPARRSVNMAVFDELLRHGLRFVAPADLGPIKRGVPTAWGVDLLAAQLASAEAAPVWPSARGVARGPAVLPLLDNAPDLVESWPEAAVDLALVDALRLGDKRAQQLAHGLLMERLSAVAAA